MQYIYKYQSPIGGITIASDGSSLTGLWFDGQKYFCSFVVSGTRRKSIARIRANHRMARLLFQWEKSRFHA